MIFHLTCFTAFRAGHFPPLRSGYFHSTLNQPAVLAVWWWRLEKIKWTVFAALDLFAKNPLFGSVISRSGGLLKGGRSVRLSGWVIRSEYQSVFHLIFGEIHFSGPPDHRRWSLAHLTRWRAISLRHCSIMVFAFANSFLAEGNYYVINNILGMISALRFIAAGSPGFVPAPT